MPKHAVKIDGVSSYGQKNGSDTGEPYDGRHRLEDKLAGLSDRNPDETVIIVNGGWFGGKKK